MMRTKVAVSGFSSNVGKTTLVCDLLRAFPGWEAIKVTRGHYRSCGKDPHACCVSHLLGEEPLIRSGRELTYAPGKDTGRYWDAGASNVHWLIVTEQQVERGIRSALERVRAEGVLIEGTSFLNFVEVDVALMAAPSRAGRIKPSARRVLKKISALYLSDEDVEGTAARERFRLWRQSSPDRAPLDSIPVYTREQLPEIVARLRAISSAPAAV